VQTCIWPSGFHCHSLSLASVKSRLVLPFWYRLTRVVPYKGPLNGCVCVVHIHPQAHTPDPLLYLNYQSSQLQMSNSSRAGKPHALYICKIVLLIQNFAAIVQYMLRSKISVLHIAGRCIVRFREMQQCGVEMMKCVAEFGAMQQRCCEAEAQLKSVQLARQKDIWQQLHRWSLEVTN